VYIDVYNKQHRNTADYIGLLSFNLMIANRPN